MSTISSSVDDVSISNSNLTGTVKIGGTSLDTYIDDRYKCITDGQNTYATNISTNMLTLANNVTLTGTDGVVTDKISINTLNVGTNNVQTDHTISLTSDVAKVDLHASDTVYTTIEPGTLTFSNSNTIKTAIKALSNGLQLPAGNVLYIDNMLLSDYIKSVSPTINCIIDPSLSVATRISTKQLNTDKLVPVTGYDITYNFLFDTVYAPIIKGVDLDNSDYMSDTVGAEVSNCRLIGTKNISHPTLQPIVINHLSPLSIDTRAGISDIYPVNNIFSGPRGSKIIYTTGEWIDNVHNPTQSTATSMSESDGSYIWLHGTTKSDTLDVTNIQLVSGSNTITHDGSKVVINTDTKVGNKLYVGNSLIDSTPGFISMGIVRIDEIADAGVLRLSSSHKGTTGLSTSHTDASLTKIGNVLNQYDIFNMLTNIITQLNNMTNKTDYTTTLANEFTISTDIKTNNISPMTGTTLAISTNASNTTFGGTSLSTIISNSVPNVACITDSNNNIATEMRTTTLKSDSLTSSTSTASINMSSRFPIIDTLKINVELACAALLKLSSSYPGSPTGSTSHNTNSYAAVANTLGTYDIFNTLSNMLRQLIYITTGGTTYKDSTYVSTLANSFTPSSTIHGGNLTLHNGSSTVSISMPSTTTLAISTNASNTTFGGTSLSTIISNSVPNVACITDSSNQYATEVRTNDVKLGSSSSYISVKSELDNKLENNDYADSLTLNKLYLGTSSTKYATISAESDGTVSIFPASASSAKTNIRSGVISNSTQFSSTNTKSYLTSVEKTDNFTELDLFETIDAFGSYTQFVIQMNNAPSTSVIYDYNDGASIAERTHITMNDMPSSGNRLYYVLDIMFPQFFKRGYYTGNLDTDVYNILSSVMNRSPTININSLRKDVTNYSYSSQNRHMYANTSYIDSTIPTTTSIMVFANANGYGQGLVIPTLLDTRNSVITINPTNNYLYTLYREYFCFDGKCQYNYISDSTTIQCASSGDWVNPNSEMKVTMWLYYSSTGIPSSRKTITLRTSTKSITLNLYSYIKSGNYGRADYIGYGQMDLNTVFTTACNNSSSPSFIMVYDSTGYIPNVNLSTLATVNIYSTMFNKWYIPKYFNYSSSMTPYYHDYDSTTDNSLYVSMEEIPIDSSPDEKIYLCAPDTSVVLNSSNREHWYMNISYDAATYGTLYFGLQCDMSQSGWDRNSSRLTWLSALKGNFSGNQTYNVDNGSSWPTMSFSNNTDYNVLQCSISNSVTQLCISYIPNSTSARVIPYVRRIGKYLSYTIAANASTRFYNFICGTYFSSTFRSTYNLAFRFDTFTTDYITTTNKYGFYQNVSAPLSVDDMIIFMHDVDRTTSELIGCDTHYGYTSVNSGDAIYNLEDTTYFSKYLIYDCGRRITIYRVIKALPTYYWHLRCLSTTDSEVVTFIASKSKLYDNTLSLSMRQHVTVRVPWCKYRLNQVFISNQYTDEEYITWTPTTKYVRLIDANNKIPITNINKVQMVDDSQSIYAKLPITLYTHYTPPDYGSGYIVLHHLSGNCRIGAFPELWRNKRFAIEMNIRAMSVETMRMNGATDTLTNCANSSAADASLSNVTVDTTTYLCKSENWAEPNSVWRKIRCTGDSANWFLPQWITYGNNARSTIKLNPESRYYWSHRRLFEKNGMCQFCYDTNAAVNYAMIIPMSGQWAVEGPRGQHLISYIYNGSSPPSDNNDVLGMNYGASGWVEHPLNDTTYFKKYRINIDDGIYMYDYVLTNAWEDIKPTKIMINYKRAITSTTIYIINDMSMSTSCVNLNLSPMCDIPMSRLHYRLEFNTLASSTYESLDDKLMVSYDDITHGEKYTFIGSGTSGDPYLIYSTDELKYMCNSYNTSSTHVKLMVDIYEFQALTVNLNIDGNGHVISGPTTIIATLNGTVKNVHFKPVTITYSYTVINANNGTISNCRIDYETDTWTVQDNQPAFILGIYNNYGTMSNIYLTGNITYVIPSSSTKTVIYSNNLAGYNYGTIEYCTTKVNLVCTDNKGGVIIYHRGITSQNGNSTTQATISYCAVDDTYSSNITAQLSGNNLNSNINNVFWNTSGSHTLLKFAPSASATWYSFTNMVSYPRDGNESGSSYITNYTTYMDLFKNAPQLMIYDGIIQYDKYATQRWTGSGTSADPYILTEELYYILCELGNDVTGYYKLDSTIRLSYGARTISSFSGTLDGNNQCIVTDKPLINLNSGTIKNVIVHGEIACDANAASICLTNTGTIDGCRYLSSVSDTAGGYIYGSNRVAGICSTNRGGRIFNCECNSSIYAFDAVYAGGICALNDNNGIIRNCLCTGSVYGYNTTYVAGICAYSDSTNYISTSIFLGNIPYGTNKYAICYQSAVADCYYAKLGMLAHINDDGSDDYVQRINNGIITGGTNVNKDVVSIMNTRLGTGSKSWTAYNSLGITYTYNKDSFNYTYESDRISIQDIGQLSRAIHNIKYNVISYNTVFSSIPHNMSCTCGATIDFKIGDLNIYIIANSGRIRGCSLGDNPIFINRGTLIEISSRINRIRGLSKDAGICIHNLGKIEWAYNDATISATDYAAGIAVYNYGTIDDSFNHGELIASHIYAITTYLRTSSIVRNTYYLEGTASIGIPDGFIDPGWINEPLTYNTDQLLEDGSPLINHLSMFRVGKYHPLLGDVLYKEVEQTSTNAVTTTTNTYAGLTANVDTGSAGLTLAKNLNSIWSLRNETNTNNLIFTYNGAGRGWISYAGTHAQMNTTIKHTSKFREPDIRIDNILGRCVSYDGTVGTFSDTGYSITCSPDDALPNCKLCDRADSTYYGIIVNDHRNDSQILSDGVIATMINVDGCNAVRVATHGDALVACVNDVYNAGDILIPDTNGYARKCVDREEKMDAMIDKYIIGKVSGIPDHVPYPIDDDHIWVAVMLN